MPTSVELIGKMSENGWVVICPTLTMCPLHLSNGGSTILMLSSVILNGYELLAYTIGNLESMYKVGGSRGEHRRIGGLV